MFDDVGRLCDNLSEFLGLTSEEAERMGTFIEVSTSSDTIAPSHRRQHELTRNSHALANAWHEKYSEDELAYFDELVGKEYEYFREVASHAFG